MSSKNVTPKYGRIKIEIPPQHPNLTRQKAISKTKRYKVVLE